ncbi:ribonuclease T2 family protein [Hoeflea prorocentri]|uniref:Ribonuclease n=1 Tax=Hoeflea prorocentri TaxID=1922333 RepID=A0A9X3ZGS3_9HYPH|nr:ribonuclease [Hoeflea prorocentri]MCY6380101.1 ribonuclease [Hoeflea prorocentri]MDA5397901.1 ribonuclease [Hoeflea prorocentri]
MSTAPIAGQCDRQLQLLRAFIVPVCAGLFLLAGCDASDNGKTSGPSGFDFYVLALSWSPSYCEAEGERANPQQCNGARPYAFIVHGLWPQFEKGYPEFCDEGSQRVTRAIEDQMLPIMPSRGLIRHQWKKHGTCSGLDQDDYFDAVRDAHASVSVPDIGSTDGTYKTMSPDEVAQAFINANPQLEDDHFAVTCDKRRLREVRICMTTEFQYRSCPQVTSRACRRSSVVLPPVRGR